MADADLISVLPTESDWIRWYVDQCTDCAVTSPKHWYDLCSLHAPVARCAVDPAYEAWLVQQKFYALHALAWIDRMLDMADRIERGTQWIAEDPERRTERGMRRITELRGMLDPALHDWPVSWIRDLLDLWTDRLAWYETRLRFLHEEQTRYAGANHPSRSVIVEHPVDVGQLC